MITAIALLAQAATAQAAPEPTRLELTCGGGGTANKIVSGRGYAWNNSGDSANVITSRQVGQGFADEVSLWIEADDGRIRMPRTMLPPIRGGEDGWFKLKNIVVGEREITASASVNFANNPKIRIDRVTGGISISGKAGDFTGQCERIDPASQRRF